MVEATRREDVSADRALDEAIACWRAAALRARVAEEAIVRAFAAYVAGAGALPSLNKESDVAMRRVEATALLEQVFVQAKRLRRPSPVQRRRAVPRSSAPSPAEPDALTERQRQILTGLAAGLSSKQIGIQLGISPSTVDVHRGRIMARLGIQNLAGLVRYAVEQSVTHIWPAQGGERAD